MPGALPPPSPADLGPLLGDSGPLDTPTDPTDDEPGEFEAAAMSAVGTKAKASALKDAIESCLRSHGLLSDTESDEPADDSAPPTDEEGSDY